MLTTQTIHTILFQLLLQRIKLNLHQLLAYVRESQLRHSLHDILNNKCEGYSRISNSIKKYNHKDYTKIEQMLR